MKQKITSKLIILSILTTITGSMSGAMVLVKKDLDIGQLEFGAKVSGDIGAYYRNSKENGKKDEEKSTIPFYSYFASQFTFDVKRDDFDYGGSIGLATTGFNSRAYGTNIYVDTGIAKIVLGSDHGAAMKLKVDGSSVSKGHAFTPGYYRFDSQYLSDATSPASLRDRPYIDRHRLVSLYLTAPLSDSNKIQAGISYVPDDANLGSETQYKPNIRDHLLIKNLKASLTDLISGGVSYTGTFEEGKISVSAIGETANINLFRKTKEKKLREAKTDELKGQNLDQFNTYGVGAKFEYRNIFASAGVYSLGKSYNIPGVTDGPENNSSTYAFSSGAGFKVADSFSVSYVYNTTENLIKTTHSSHNLAFEYTGVEYFTAYAGISIADVVTKKSLSLDDISSISLTDDSTPFSLSVKDSKFKQEDPDKKTKLSKITGGQINLDPKGNSETATIVSFGVKFDI